MTQIELLPETHKNFDLSFKIILIGDARSGKTSLSSKATRNTFDSNYYSTIGFEFFTFHIKINEKAISLQIWDTCGQETYRSLISSFYSNSSLGMIFYSIDDKNSFIHIENWMHDLKTLGSPNTKIFLVGNKCDLENSRQISKEEGLKYKNDNKLDMFFETSAKRGDNVKEIFIEAAKILYEENNKKNEKKRKNKMLFRYP